VVDGSNTYLNES